MLLQKLRAEIGQTTWPQEFILLAIVSIVSYLSYRLQGYGGLYYSFSWPEQLHMLLSDGQVWRLITPVFMHFSPWHLLINLFFLHWLTVLWHQRYSRAAWWLLALCAALFGNLAQGLIVGPEFGGLSGVVYGFFGHALVVAAHDFWRGQLNPSANVLAQPELVGGLLLLLVLGFTGIIGQLANYAHGFGLLSGLCAAVLQLLWQHNHGRINS